VVFEGLLYAYIAYMKYTVLHKNKDNFMLHTRVHTCKHRCNNIEYYIKNTHIPSVDILGAMT